MISTVVSGDHDRGATTLKTLADFPHGLNPSRRPVDENQDHPELTTRLARLEPNL
jgi:hypothetical protein